MLTVASYPFRTVARAGLVVTSVTLYSCRAAEPHTPMTTRVIARPCPARPAGVDDIAKPPPVAEPPANPSAREARAWIEARASEVSILRKDVSKARDAAKKNRDVLSALRFNDACSQLEANERTLRERLETIVPETDQAKIAHQLAVAKVLAMRARALLDELSRTRAEPCFDEVWR